MSLGVNRLLIQYKLPDGSITTDPALARAPGLPTAAKAPTATPATNETMPPATPSSSAPATKVPMNKPAAATPTPSTKAPPAATPTTSAKAPPAATPTTSAKAPPAATSGKGKGRGGKRQAVKQVPLTQEQENRFEDRVDIILAGVTQQAGNVDRMYRDMRDMTSRVDKRIENAVQKAVNEYWDDVIEPRLIKFTQAIKAKLTELDDFNTPQRSSATTSSAARATASPREREYDFPYDDEQDETPSPAKKSRSEREPFDSEDATPSAKKESRAPKKAKKLKKLMPAKDITNAEKMVLLRLIAQERGIPVDCLYDRVKDLKEKMGEGFRPMSSVQEVLEEKIYVLDRYRYGNVFVATIDNWQRVGREAKDKQVVDEAAESALNAFIGA